MGIIVGILSLFLGMFIFIQGLASLLIGLPLAIKTATRRATKIYIANAIWTWVVNIVVIVLVVTVLKEFLAWIIICYFIVPLIVFFLAMNMYEREAKEMISKEIEEEKLKAQMLIDLIDSFSDKDKFNDLK